MRQPVTNFKTHTNYTKRTRELDDRGVALFHDRHSCEDHSKPKNQTKASSSDRYFQHKHVKNIFEKQLKNKYLVLNNITFFCFSLDSFSLIFNFKKLRTINVHNSLEHLSSIRHHCISNPDPNSNHIHLEFYIPYVLIYPFRGLLFFPHLLTRC